MKVINCLLLMVLLLGSISFVHAQDFTKVWEFTDFGRYVGTVGLKTTDINQDGKEEIVFDGGTRNILFIGYHVEGENYHFESIGFRSSIVDFDIANWNGEKVIGIFLSDGMLQVLSLTTLTTIATIDTEMTNSTLTGKVYFDQHSGNQQWRIFVAGFQNNNSLLKWYNFDNNQLQFVDETSTENLSFSILRGDVNGDNANELIIGSYDNFVKILSIEGSQFELIANLPILGRGISLADVNNDGRLDILHMLDEQLSAYDGYNFELISSQSLATTSAGRYVVVDLDNNGTKEIVLVNQSPTNAIHVYDYDSGDLLWQLSEDFPAPNGEVDFDDGLSFRIMDVNNDGILEILIIDGIFVGQLTAVDGLSREILWEVAADGPDPKYVALANLDDTEGLDLVWGTGSVTAWSKSVLTIFDPQTEQIKFRNPYFENDVRSHINDLNNDQSKDIVLGAVEIDNINIDKIHRLRFISIHDHQLWHEQIIPDSLGQFYRLTSATTRVPNQNELIWSTGKDLVIFNVANMEILSHFSGNSSIYSLATTDFDQDGLKEILVSYGNGMVKMIDYNGSTYEEIYHDFLLNNTDIVTRMYPGNFDQDPAMELAFYQSEQLKVIDLSSFELQWTSPLDFPVRITTGDLNQDGILEIVAYQVSEGGIVLDGATGEKTFFEVNLPSASYIPSQIAIANVDASPNPEIVMCWPLQAQVLDGQNYEQLYDLFYPDQAVEKIAIGQFNNNELLDCMISTERGIIHYEFNLVSTVHPQISSNASLQVYPNPTSDLINVEYTGPYSENNLFVEVYDLSGKQMARRHMNGNRESIDISNWYPGLYLIRILADEAKLQMSSTVIKL